MQEAILTIACVLGLLATAPARAHAGEYTVYSCKTPDGEPNGVSAEGGGGWTLGRKQGFAAPADDTCGQWGGALTAALWAEYQRPANDRIEWDYVAPPSTRLTSFRIVWSGQVGPVDPGGAGGDAYILRGSLADPNYTVRHYINPATWTNEVIGESGLDEAVVHFGIACSGAGTCGNSAAANFAISSAVVTLRDTAAPTGSISGQAVDDQTWVGVEPFAYAAADSGGGVYRVLVLVDGESKSTRIAGSNDGHCVAASSVGGTYVFNSPHPCQPAASGLAAIDVAGLPNGVHDVSIAVEDAGGNVSTVYSARKTIVAPGRRIGPGSDLTERGAANGDNAADDARLFARWVRTARATLNGPYGRREVVRGG